MTASSNNPISCELTLTCKETNVYKNDKTEHPGTAAANQIIDAVRYLITTTGMEGVTIDAIAEEVGLTEGAIYRHFTSKHQILLLLIDDIERSLLETVRNARLEWASALKNLERILEAHLSDVEGHRAASFIVITEAIGFDSIGLGPRVA